MSASLGTPNPYATPKAMVADDGAGSEAEAVRKEHITHEASVKAVGILFMLGGVLTLIGAGVGLFAPGATAGENKAVLVVAGLVIGALSIAIWHAGGGCGPSRRGRVFLPPSWQRSACSVFPSEP